LAGKDAIAISRKLMGATFGSKAEPGTIRGDFGVSNTFNLVHGSDSADSAQREIGLFFKPEELLEWQPAVQGWVYDLSKGQPE
jgi:nucleoside-diphosphate kinase